MATNLLTKMIEEKTPKQEPEQELILSATQELPQPILPTEKVRIEEIEGLFPADTAVPTHDPKRVYEQIVPYESGGTYRLYQYIKDAWKVIYDSTLGTLTSTQVTDLTDAGTTTLHKHVAGYAGHINISLPAWHGSIQGDWQLSTAVEYWGYGAINNGAAEADADDVSWEIDIPPGTYKLIVLAFAYSAGGIIDVYLAGSEVASFNLYSGTDDYNTRFTQTGIVVTTGGVQTLKFLVDGKHASSSSYNILINQISLYRTA